MPALLALAAALGLLVLKTRANSGSSNRQERLEWLATHEAGHTIVAWCCPLVGAVTGVTIDSVSGGRLAWSGLTTHDWRVPPGGLERQQWDIVIALAGLAAEVLAYGEIRTLPPRRDITDALASVRVLCKEHGCAPSAAPSWSLPLDVRCSPIEASQLERGWTIASRLLAARRDVHAELARVLAIKKMLDAAELAAMLGPRG